MAESTGYVRSYLAPSADAPWRWEEDGRVLAWANGGTLAFRLEVERVLQRLANESQIVPPFLEIVLLFAAARSNPRGTLATEQLGWIAAQLESCAGGANSKQAARDSLDEIGTLLRRLETVPVSFWSSDEALELLAVHVVERSGQARDPHAAKMLARALEHGLPPWSFTSNAGRHAGELEKWIEAFTLLRHGLSRFDAGTLLLRARTGLEQLPAALELPLDSRAGARALLDSLRENPELGPLAALAREITALVHLPRPVADRTELPLGGVSDISNRGSLERLLASELAHDDLTLAIRVATNEALYMRREAPSQPRAGLRCILVDTGIRSWGTPRVFAAAVALGLAAITDSHDRALAWRTAGDALAKLDLSCREGLLELLSTLEPEPDPSAAFRSFFENSPHGSVSARELFLVVTAATAESRELRACLLEHSPQGFFLVVVDANGHLRLESWGARGVRTLQRSTFELDALRRAILGAPAASASPGETLLPDQHPAFLLQRPLPLLFSYGSGRSRFCAKADSDTDGHFQLTSQGDLLLWDSRQKGGRVIDTLDPNLRVALFQGDALGRIHLVHGGSARAPWYWTQVDPQTCERRSHELLEHWGKERALLVDQRLVLLDHGWLKIVEEVGEQLRITPVPASAAHLHGRFFRSNSKLLALSWSSGTTELLDVCPAASFPEDVIAVFDWPGHDGPWTISKRSARIVSTATGETCEIQGLDLPRCESLQVLSPNVLFLNQQLRVDLGAARAYRLEHPWLGFLAANEQRFSLLQSIGCSPSGDLVVESKSTKTFVVAPGSSRHLSRCLLVQHIRDPLSSRTAFHKGRSPFAGLRVARSPLGSVALSDWRGLLHLRSHDASLPEITLALVHDRPLRLWCAEGWSHGEPLFLPDGPTRDADHALNLLRAHAEGFR